MYTDVNGQHYSNEFAVDSFKMNMPATAIKDRPLQISFEGIDKKYEYCLELNATNTDSSFSISHSQNDQANYVEIPALQLKRQPGNQLQLNVSLVKKLPLQNSTKEGGAIEIEYKLKPVTITLEESLPVAVNGVPAQQ